MKFDPTPLIRLLETIMFIFPYLILYVPIEVSSIFFLTFIPAFRMTRPQLSSDNFIQRTERGEVA